MLTVITATRLVAGDPLADGFLAPPPDARPHTWWHWVNGNVSKEGITADLEAMQRIGVGGAQIFNVARGEMAGPVNFLSPEWLALTRHAMAEGDRLGLEMTMQNCAGWSESGGPWITPPLAMQQVVWTETRVQGGRKLAIGLPQPTTVAGYYEDIAVLALPAHPVETLSLASLAPRVTTTAAGVDAGRLLENRAGEAVLFPAPTPETPQSIQLEFGAPQSAASVRFAVRDNSSLPLGGNVEVSDDGTTFRSIAEIPVLARGDRLSCLVRFPPTTARIFRFTVTKITAGEKAMALTGLELGGPRLPHSEAQAGFRADASLRFSTVEVAPGQAIVPQRIIDLTAAFRDGQLDWDAPAGDWTIVRFGHTPTGKRNSPAPETGRGLECDKMNRAAVELHFASLMGRVIEAVGPLAGRSFKYVLADSWEAGCQNWTPAMRAEFQRRRGYDLLPWLPAVAGRVVGSTEQSERFLWDFRQTISELIVENHYGVLQELCHKNGMLFTAEAPGINMPTIADELAAKGRTDVPMGEFWMSPPSDYWKKGPNDSKEAAVAAHIYGRPIVAAEAFTAAMNDAKWSKAPFDHKMLGDLHYTLGINRFVFHRYAHQPWLDRVPGMTMGPYGTNFERTNTWWEQAAAWMKYLSRCQYLLQRGNFVGDVCYFYGEGAPNTLTNREPELPVGYDYDAINAEVLLTRLTVRDGQLVLPDGPSYRLLLLPGSATMTPVVLRKLRDLVSAGATVVGARPERSPSLTDYPACDAEVKTLAAEVWGDCDGKKVTEHAYGRGRVVQGRALGEVLAAMKTGPDFAAEDTTGKFAYIHRQLGEAEVYFVSSQNADATQATLSFRVTGRVPELWHADTGRMERVAQFRERDGQTLVPVGFDPAGSVFVVFRASNRAVDPVISFARDGGAVSKQEALTVTDDGTMTFPVWQSGTYEMKTASGRTLRATVAPLPGVTELTGAWTVKFPPGWGAPAEWPLAQLASWTEQANEGVKHFSGTATYVKEFDLAPEAIASGRILRLDLGRVKEIAEVKLNGQDLGALWKPPFHIALSGAAHAGKNRLEVRVTNLWPNRIIGDLQLPEKDRRTWTTFNPFKADSPLLESGLLGPVRIEVGETVVFK